MTEPAPAEDESVYCWTAHPLRERPGAGLLATVVIVLLSAVVAWGLPLGAALVTALVVVIGMVAVLHRFFLPSRFQFDRREVVARYALKTERAAWRDVRRWTHDAHGVYLSSRGRPSRLDAFRGVHLLFGNHREEILEQLRRRLAEVSEEKSAGT